MRRKEVDILYSNYKRLSVQWNEDKGAFTIFHDDIGMIARDIHLKSITGLDGSVYEIGDYDRSVSARSNGLQISYSGKRCSRRGLSISITLTDDGAKIFVSGDGGADHCLSGWLPVGEGKGRMAVRLDGKDDILRAAVGPATLPGCRGVFAPEMDAAVTVDGLGIPRIRYDWEKEDFAFEYHTMHRDYAGELHLHIRENLYKNAFHLDYKPMGPAAAGGPPVGWMSWYAVEFREGEDAVLENARFQKEKLAAWGANTIWVDWLWCHRDFTGLERRVRISSILQRTLTQTD